MISQPDKIGILLVDDSELLLKFAGRVLKDLDEPLYTAENGVEGWAMMELIQPGVLVTDLMMPEMDGFELIRQTRADERFQQTHIIVMTALDQTQDKVRALSLGANDYTVKPLDAAEFAARVRAGLREMRLKRKLSDLMAAQDSELQKVARLQQRLLPKSPPQGQGFTSDFLYLPCTQAGGDYLDCLSDPDGRPILVVADVSGHGASAAVLMAVTRALLKMVAAEGGTAGRITDRLNEALLDNVGDAADFVTAFIGLFDAEKMSFNYCGAGHGNMLLLGPKQGALQRLSPGGTVLGCFPGQWEDGTVGLEAGQSLILYTDGLVECVNEAGEEFSAERLEKILSETDPGLEPAELIETIKAELAAFTSEVSFEDDLTLFVIRFLGDHPG